MQKYFFFLFFALSLASCKTTERTTHKAVEHLADTLAQQSIQDGRVVDSLARVSIQQWWTEMQSTMQQHSSDSTKEQIIEEITTITDSVGTTTRTEHRTTTRNTLSQSSQYSQASQSSYASMLDSINSRLDRMELTHGSLFKATKHDNISEDKQKVSKPSKKSLWWALGISLAIIIVAHALLSYLRFKDKI